MKSISIAVITDNIEYGRAFGLALLNICRYFIISIFGKDEFLDKSKALKEGAPADFARQYDLILWDGKEVQSIYRGNMVFMTDRPSLAVKNFHENKYSVYKYDSAQDMVGSILEIYSGITGGRTVNIKKDNIRFFSFCSGSGGSGCTTLAMAAGQELSRFYGKKVMYISFENLESTGDFIESRSGVRSLGYYLYNLFRKSYGTTLIPAAEKTDGHKPPGGFMESYIITDDFGMEAFAPSMGINPLNEMNENETLTFLSSLTETGRYDVIIADLGNSVSPAAIACAEMSERLCLVSQSGVSESREEHYIQYLICRCGENIADRIIKVKNMSNRESRKTGQEKPAMMDTDLHVVKCSEFVYEGDVKKLVLENEFENRIHMLTEMITEPIHKLNINLT